MERLRRFILLVCCVVYTIASPATAWALDDKQKELYSANNIPFLDDNDSECAVQGSGGSATATENAREFVRKYIKAAVEVNKKYGTPYEAILAQGMLESAYGRSKLTTDGNNFFGIKADASWKGAVLTMNTDEEENGAVITIRDGFRSYPTIEEGWLDYGRFITENSRYAEALKYPGDPRRYIEEIKKAGYATDSQYVAKNISLIEQVEQIAKAENLSPPSSQIKLELVTPGSSVSTTGSGSHCSTNSTGVVSGDIVATAKNLARPQTTNTWEATTAYIAARRQYNPNVGDDQYSHTDCGKFVATVMRASGADPDYTPAGTWNQLAYVKGNSNYLVIEKPSLSDLKPGDILVNNGHTLIYAGDQGDGVWGYHASLGDTAPIQIGQGTIEYQLSQPDNVLARLIKK